MPLRTRQPENLHVGQTVFERYMPDLDSYVKWVRSGPCFVCKIVARDPASSDHHIVYEDEGSIVFLAMNPTQYGYTLVAPKDHREQVAAISRSRSTSVCSESSTAWLRLVPLPPNTPFAEQQFAAVILETAGALKIPDRDEASLAARVGQRMERS